ncbi:MAG: hypothetical protein V4689_06450 [Verrucomicrobiota bacterium]
MIKRFRWVFLAVLAGGAILWLVLPGGRQKDESAGAQPLQNKERESSRHRTGEVGKNLASPLEKKVAEQERLVEDKKEMVVALAKARAPILLSPEAALLSPRASPPSEETPEQAAKKAQATKDFEDAKREFIADRQLLQKLKLELAEEQKKNVQPALDSR